MYNIAHTDNIVKTTINNLNNIANSISQASKEIRKIIQIPDKHPYTVNTITEILTDPDTSHDKKVIFLQQQVQKEIKTLIAKNHISKTQFHTILYANAKVEPIPTPIKEIFPAEWYHEDGTMKSQYAILFAPKNRKKEELKIKNQHNEDVEDQENNNIIDVIYDKCNQADDNDFFSGDESIEALYIQLQQSSDHDIHHPKRQEIISQLVKKISSVGISTDDHTTQATPDDGALIIKKEQQERLLFIVGEQIFNKKHNKLRNEYESSYTNSLTITETEKNFTTKTNNNEDITMKEILAVVCIRYDKHYQHINMPLKGDQGFVESILKEINTIRSIPHLVNHTIRGEDIQQAVVNYKNYLKKTGANREFLEVLQKMEQKFAQ